MITESDLRIILARKQNEILQTIYNNINSDKFDLSVDLSKFPATSLKDFWVYTSGFLSIQNFESIIENMSDKEVDDILEGKFKLKSLTNEEANAFAKSAGKTIPTYGVSHIINLYTIQDGTYKLNKGVSRVTSNGQQKPNWLSLETDGIMYYCDDPNLEISSKQVMNIIRNLIVHRTPYINGSKLTFVGENQEIVVSKMWLRGYSELFSQNQSNVDAETIEKVLTRELAKSRNYINDPAELDKALSNIVHCFSPEVVKNYFRVNNFVKLRVQYYNDFYKKPLDEKIKIISAICANNPRYTTGSNESIEPSIIYNIQQIIAKELANRGAQEILSEDDNDTESYFKVKAEVDEADKALDNFGKNTSNTNSQFAKTQLKRLMLKYQSAYKKLLNQINTLENKQKLESSHAEIYNLYGLEYLPVEVAVNVVCLMGYNSLVTSAFYEDLIANASAELNEQQKSFFKSISFDGIKTSYFGEKVTGEYSPEEKMYLLKCIRDAICHNHITFTLSPVKKGDDFNFEDVKLAFTADWNRTVISGRVADFFKLFGLENFMKERSNEIVNGKVHVVVSDEDMGNFDEETLSSNTKNNQSKVDDQSNNSNGQPGDE